MTVTLWFFKKFVLKVYQFSLLNDAPFISLSKKQPVICKVGDVKTKLSSLLAQDATAHRQDCKFDKKTVLDFWS